MLSPAKLENHLPSHFTADDGLQQRTEDARLEVLPRDIAKMVTSYLSDQDREVFVDGISNMSDGDYKILSDADKKHHLFSSIVSNCPSVVNLPPDYYQKKILYYKRKQCGDGIRLCVCCVNAAIQVPALSIPWTIFSIATLGFSFVVSCPRSCGVFDGVVDGENLICSWLCCPDLTIKGEGKAGKLFRIALFCALNCFFPFENSKHSDLNKAMKNSRDRYGISYNNSRFFSGSCTPLLQTKLSYDACQHHRTLELHAESDKKRLETLMLFEPTMPSTPTMMR